MQTALFQRGFMGCNGHSGSKSPRNMRIILGGTLALISFFLGSIIFVDRYHRATTMSDSPQEMQWTTLAEKGLTETSFVTFTNVKLAGADPASMAVVPIGADPFTTRRLLVLDPHERSLTEAKVQLEELGTLTGHVTRFSGDEFTNYLFQVAGLEPTEERQELALETAVYTIAPMKKPLDKKQAGNKFWLCGFALTVGLLLCCRGGPSAVFGLVFFVPSLISLFGYPMRYGRGNKIVRWLYIAAGIGMIGYGYKLMVFDGQFGHVNGNPILHALGFASGFVGLAAFMSVPCQTLVRKFTGRTGAKSCKKGNEEDSQQEACSSTPVDEVASQYSDGVLVKRTEALCREMKETVDSLAPLGFEQPIELDWKRDEAVIPTAIQLGCQNMVVADLELVDEQIHSRLVSVLHDGLTVVTVSRNSPVESDSRLGANGFYCAGKTNTTVELMPLHLENTASLAEERGTTVVKIDGDEVRSVCELGRRVLADTRSQFGEQNVKVKPKTYGRFKFPARRVMGELASV